MKCVVRGRSAGKRGKGDKETWVCIQVGCKEESRKNKKGGRGVNSTFFPIFIPQPPLRVLRQRVFHLLRKTFKAEEMKIH